MLDKTKVTNEKMIGMKTQSSGMGYTSPEQLSAGVSAQSRDKKLQEQQMRDQLTAQVRNE